MKRTCLWIVAGLCAVTPVAASHYFTPDVPTALGGTTYLPSNIVLKDDAGLYSLVLALPAGTSLDGLYRLSTGQWLLSVADPIVLGGISFDPRDVIRFDGAAYFTFLNGAAAGIPRGSNVDALFLDGGDSGDLIVSFDVPTTIGGITARPADLVRYDSGTFSLDFDSTSTSPSIPLATNVTGAGRRGSRTFLTFDVPTTLGPETYLPGQVVTWNGTRFDRFAPDAAWPATSTLSALALGPCLDGEGDGFGAPGDPACPQGGALDCDDTIDSVYPGAPQICDGLNNDCSEPTWPNPLVNDRDFDDDELRMCQGDCDDAAGTVYPGAQQVCDGLNNDCTHPSWPALAGTNEFDDDSDAWTECAGDCDDMVGVLYPAAPQTCDGLNNDCNHPSWPGLIATNEFDDDGDSRTECAGDCDDAAPGVYPAAPQICDGLNNDCSDPTWPTPLVDDTDADGDGLRVCNGDCTDTDGTVWGRPGEAIDLSFLDGTVLTWNPPTEWGGLPEALRYDTIRSTNRSDFVTVPPALCVETNDGPDSTASDFDVPPIGSAFFYLIRARNACPGPLGLGPLGTNSAGVERTARSCP